MQYLNLLPIELWIIIVRHVIDSDYLLTSFDDAQMFCALDGYLADTSREIPLQNAQCRLRLVCRSFSAMIGDYGHRKDDRLRLRSIEGLRQLRLWSKVTTLQMTLNSTRGYSFQRRFNLLWIRGELLTSLRTLILEGLEGSPQVHYSLRLWENIRDTFPNLESLYLRKTSAEKLAIGPGSQITVPSLRYLYAQDIDVLSLPFLPNLKMANISGLHSFEHLHERAPNLEILAFSRPSLEAADWMISSPTNLRWIKCPLLAYTLLSKLRVRPLVLMLTIPPSDDIDNLTSRMGVGPKSHEDRVAVLIKSAVQNCSPRQVQLDLRGHSESTASAIVRSCAQINLPFSGIPLSLNPTSAILLAEETEAAVTAEAQIDTGLGSILEDRSEKHAQATSRVAQFFKSRRRLGLGAGKG